ncbi:MAG TPA: amidohydrolase family protein, partial [Chthonomonadaceae bacterium]|nr:amidohydrolase family protein [Chthonomonadaceae bacterium]
ILGESPVRTGGFPPKLGRDGAVGGGGKVFSTPGILALLTAACLLPVQGQTRPDPFGEEVVVVRARHIETVSRGVINDGLIVIRNGKITAVGTDAKIPPGARILQADTVMPGIVGAYSQIGISAPAAQAGPALPQRFAGRGGAGGGQRPVSNPHYRVKDELYPFDENYARLLRAGVTTLALAPEGRGIAGQGALVRLQAETAEKMPLIPDGPLTIHFAPNTQTMDLIRTTFDGARPRTGGGPGGGPGGVGGRPMPPAEAEDPEEGPEEDDMQGRRGQRPPTGRPQGPANLITGSADVRREPVLRAVQGTLPTIFTCGDSASVTYLMPLLQAYTTLKPVYVLSSPETYRIADLLGQKKANIVFPAALNLEPLTVNRINVPAILTKAGAKVALRPQADTPEGYQNLRYQVGELVKYGMDRTAALRAITLAPAEMLGLGDRVGSIDTGRDANLILLDGDPFVSTTRIRSVLLEGKTVYEE